MVRSWFIKICRRRRTHFYACLLPSERLASAVASGCLRGIGWRTSGARQALPLFWAMPSIGRRFRAARRRTIKSTRTRARACSGAGGSPWRRSIPPKCGRHGTYGGGAGSWCSKRAELLAPIHNPNSQYKLPEIGQKLTYQATREGVEDHFP